MVHCGHLMGQDSGCLYMTVDSVESMSYVLLLPECGVSDHFSVPALDNVYDHVDSQDHSEDGS